MSWDYGKVNSPQSLNRGVVKDTKSTAHTNAGWGLGLSVLLLSREDSALARAGGPRCVGTNSCFP